jgi:hypothetical protein
LSFSDGAASGMLKFIFDDAMAALRASPRRAFAGGFISNKLIFGSMDL